MAQELEEGNAARIAWTEFCTIIFLTAVVGAVDSVIEAAPNIPVLVGVGAKHHHRITVFDGVVELPCFSAPRPANKDEAFDVRMWFPSATMVDGPKVKTPFERPSEGAITRALPKKIVFLTHPGVIQLASEKPVNMKCGSLGGGSSIGVEVDFLARAKEGRDDEEVGCTGGMNAGKYVQALDKLQPY